MTDETAVDTDVLVSAYVAIRDEKHDIKREMEEKLKVLDGQLEAISKALLEICESNKAESIRTAHGTVSRTVKTDYWTSDWESMYNFIKEHDAFNLLHKRINQTSMKQFLEENPDIHPEGLNVNREYEIRVTRSRNS
jgi:hypothetical protein